MKVKCEGKFVDFFFCCFFLLKLKQQIKQVTS